MAEYSPDVWAVTTPEQLAETVRAYIEGHQQIIDGPDQTFTRALAPSAREPLVALHSLLAAYEEMEQRLNDAMLRNVECLRELEEMRRENATLRENVRLREESQIPMIPRAAGERLRAAEARERKLAKEYQVHAIDWDKEATALKERAEAAERERDALQYIIDCADTPLMRDVLAERDALREALDWIEAEPEDPVKVQLRARAALGSESELASNPDPCTLTEAARRQAEQAKGLGLDALRANVTQAIAELIEAGSDPAPLRVIEFALGSESESKPDCHAEGSS